MNEYSLAKVQIIISHGLRRHAFLMVSLQINGLMLYS